MARNKHDRLFKVVCLFLASFFERIKKICRQICGKKGVNKVSTENEKFYCKQEKTYHKSHVEPIKEKNNTRQPKAPKRISSLNNPKARKVGIELLK